jgi:hypothetical protein
MLHEVHRRARLSHIGDRADVACRACRSSGRLSAMPDASWTSEGGQNYSRKLLPGRDFWASMRCSQPMSRNHAGPLLECFTCHHEP